MIREIYLIRHSEGLKDLNMDKNSDILQLQNEKNPLSIKGEEKAKEYSSNNEFLNIDYLVSSNYVRAISTAKYFMLNNNVILNINSSFGERKHGVLSWSELPEGFENKQMIDENFKVGNGENRKEVTERMSNALDDIIYNSNYKKVVILSHATAITFLLMKLGYMKDGNLMFNENIVIEKEFTWGAPDGFKLIFEDNNLISINHISF